MLRGIQALNPSIQIFADIGSVSSFAEPYGADVDDLSRELHEANHLSQCMKVKDWPTALVGIIRHIERYGDAFAEFHRLVSDETNVDTSFGGVFHVHLVHLLLQWPKTYELII